MEKVNGPQKTVNVRSEDGELEWVEIGGYGYPWPSSMAGGIIIGIGIGTHHSPLTTLTKLINTLLFDCIGYVIIECYLILFQKERR